MARTRQMMGDEAMLKMSRQALAEEGRCDIDAPKAAVAALAFEQMYLARMTQAVKLKGDVFAAKGAQPAAQCQWARATRLLTAEVVRELTERGLVVIDGALSSDEAAELRAEVAALDAAGRLHEVPAQSKALVRNDRVGFFASDEGSPTGLQLARRLLRAVPAEVCRHAGWSLLCPQKVMAAIYDGSPQRPTYYVKHLDGGSGGNPRRLTAILYLNADWDVARQGGALRAYLPGGGFRDVEPRAGRLLLFNSRTIEHEVRPTYAPCMALTLWALDAPS